MQVCGSINRNRRSRIATGRIVISSRNETAIGLCKINCVLDIFYIFVSFAVETKYGLDTDFRCFP